MLKSYSCYTWRHPECKHSPFSNFFNKTTPGYIWWFISFSCDFTADSRVARKWSYGRSHDLWLFPLLYVYSTPYILHCKEWVITLKDSVLKRPIRKTQHLCHISPWIKNIYMLMAVVPVGNKGFILFKIWLRQREELFPLIRWFPTYSQ